MDINNHIMKTKGQNRYILSLLFTLLLNFKTETSKTTGKKRVKKEAVL